MTKVSVIVPVYNPGSDIDELLESLLGQTMPAGELELIFVDDGSTDATPARLDELAAAHRHVRVQHIPNSGWPGKPRNLGIDMAQGEYVFFADNDDWLEADAIERLHATAVQDRADIVIGKVVGHGKPVPLRIFEANRHAIGFDSDLLLGLLTPAKLFRRRLLDERGLRFPEGRRRLEDHVFVVAGLLRGRADLRARGPPRLPLDAPRGAGQRLLPALRRRRATSTTSARCSTSSRPSTDARPAARRAAAALVPRQDAQPRRRRATGSGARTTSAASSSRRSARSRWSASGRTSTSGCRSTCGCARSCCAAATSTRSGGCRASSGGSRRSCASAGSSAAARTWCCGWSRGSAPRARACASSARASGPSGSRRPTTSPRRSRARTAR